MKKIVLIQLLALLALISCEEKFEPVVDQGDTEFLPLIIGNYWIYNVDQTIHFGENDSETEQFFYKDIIRSFYLNAEVEPVYIVERSKSYDRTTWVKELEYTIHQNKNLLIRTVQNQPMVILNLPLLNGKVWNGNAFRVAEDDEFELKSLAEDQIRVNQEDLDDKITVRDVRYEVFQKQVGLVEKFEDVITYCSRNDCLGQELIDGGYRQHLTLVDYGKN